VFFMGAAAVSYKSRPNIGIPCRLNTGKARYELRETYADAVYAAGGAPLLIPLIPEPDYIDSVLDNLDGLCLSGAGNDIDPLRYGREPRPGLGLVIPRRDETDFLLLAGAEARQLPVLAICFGIQSLNVYRGGTLIQDITSDAPGSLKHMQEGQYERNSHSVSLSEGSLLAELAGATSVQVNSYHHQAVDAVGDGLEAIAWAPDSIIEAVINTRRGQFALGIQWHPEVTSKTDKLSRAIFAHFISQAELHSKSRQLAGSEA
jgi:putative glutamine amidotransferase